MLSNTLAVALVIPLALASIMGTTQAVHGEQETEAAAAAGFNRLVEQEQRFILDKLKQPGPQEGNVIRSSALVIALVTHQRIGSKGANDLQLAFLRTQAMMLANAKDVEERKKLAGALFPI